MKMIGCPKCDFEMEGLINDEGCLDETYIPEHYCYPLSDDFTTSYYLINNKWIKGDE